MNPFEFVVALFFIWMIGNIVKARHRGQLPERPGRTVEPDASEIRQLREDIRSLKDRMAVMERIVTDDSYRLAKEIESLPPRSFEAHQPEMRGR